MRLLIVSLAAFIATEATAEGFAAQNLSTVATKVGSAIGKGFNHKVDPKRATFQCTDCKGSPIIDFQIGRQNDGTEGRVRSGQTTISQLEQLCQLRNPSCKLSKLEVSPAVGWISNWTAGPVASSTAVILRDGDILTIRSISSDADMARDYAEKAAQAALRHIVGK
ncbi:hypothetical protein [Microvirga solisilvae]|uniref:hypothetical protein n=1 Tax=Microvirga solisilvae TaxID=2919498 RepID=UPI001FAF2553|nr:hypothetical protein [Microvirga solisilvae]